MAAVHASAASAAARRAAGRARGAPRRARTCAARFHTVRDGESLSSIAYKNRVDLEQVEADNPMGDYDMIYPGQVVSLPGAAPYTDVSGLVPLLAVAAAVVWERRTGGSTGIRAAAADALKKAKTAITSAASSVKDRLPKGDGSTGGGGDVKAAAADAPKQAKAAIASIFSNLKGLLPKGGPSKGGGDAKSIAAAEAKRDRAAAEATEAAQVFLSKSDEVATSTAAMKIASDSEDEGEGEAKTASTSASSAKYTPKKNMWVVTSATATSSIPATRAGSNRAGQTASASASSATPQKKDMWKPVAFFAGLAALAGLSVAK